MSKKTGYVLSKAVLVEVDGSREKREIGASVDDLDEGQLRSMIAIGTAVESAGAPAAKPQPKAKTETKAPADKA